MTKLINRLLAVSLLIVAAMAVASVMVGAGLPVDARLPIHWNINGEADGFASRNLALMILPAMALALTLLFVFLPKLEPRLGHLEASRGLYAASWLGVMVVLGGAHGMLLARAMGHVISVISPITLLLALLLVVLGNFLGKSRSMFFIGIRTPWTLSSEEVWSRTHRLCGLLFVVAGLAALGAVLTGVADRLILRGLVAAIATIALGATVYSWLLWRREQSDREPDA